MVRENKDLADELGDSPGVDANKGVSLEDELKKAGKWQGDTVDPEGTMTNSVPIDIRADMEKPEKRG
jgi:hypothetical protein